ncbi:DUF1364 domain-containing protein [Chitinimonas arctica]|uniref:DUF1364 domain-containing protein n=1 Tax=Chitinimonas arctica TaxID=2594795 RepID=A0A516SAY8_9NEIS|nr:nuclease domain-containing protein [Chitinimonas arctica]QDQ25307.1 DUF1364 domain-containing protein [Chitinimonas arctica]
MSIHSKKLRGSAQGEDCTFQIAGICQGRTDTVVLCHLPDESHGMGLKADDISAAFGCWECHDVVDGRVRHAFAPGEKDWYLRRAQSRTLRRWVALGLVKVAG